jgi:hypothetical protein
LGVQFIVRGALPKCKEKKKTEHIKHWKSQKELNRKKQEMLGTGGQTMTDRERLIELVSAVQSMGVKYTHEETASSMGFRANAELADYLLANGVIVPVMCENCEYFMPKAILTDEYDNPLGYDGICDNCDKYTDKDDYCSCARLKEREKV